MENLKRSLQEIVGFENVRDDDFETVCYSRGWSVEGPFSPLIIVRPQNKEQIADILRIANRNKIPVSPYGGNSELVGSHAKQAICIDMTKMRGVLEIDEQTLTVTALAGTTWEELLYELGKKGWTTGPHLHSGPSATLGGSIALCSNGVTGAKYGLVGHQVVGLEVVLPNGDILKTGSAAHPSAKNFVRYAWGSDIGGLFIGSHGIFGVITEITLNIYPFPQEGIVSGYEYETIESAANALHEIQKRRIPIEMARIQVPKTISLFWPTIKGNAALIPIVTTGTKEEIAIWKNQIDKICLKEGKEIKDNEAIKNATNDWRRIYYYCPDWRAWAKEWDGCSMQIPLCNAIPTPYFPKFHAEFENMCEKEKISDYKIVAYCVAFASAPNAVNATPHIIYDERDLASWKKADEFARKTTLELIEMGHTPHYMGRLRATPEVMWRLGSYNELIRVLKRVIDPNNIMNPGQLMTPEI